MFVKYLEAVAQRQDLTREEMIDAIAQVVSAQVPEPQVAGLLMALRVKGETAEEVAGAAQALRQRAVPLPITTKAELCTAGTGGDGVGSLNLSTAAAIVAAGAGVRVAKHGNRSISSRCGSADVLQAMGVPTEAGVAATAAMIDEIGIGFLFAPIYHPAMKAVAGLRRTLAVRTLFNMLGPLTNPAGVTHNLAGVYSAERAPLMAEVFQALGTERTLVVHGAGGLDEIAPHAETLVLDVTPERITTLTVTPKDFGLDPIPLDAIKGDDAETNAAALLAILGGEKHPARNAVLLNSAGALMAAGRAESFLEAAALAERTIDSGAAMAKLDALRNFNIDLPQGDAA